MEATTPAAAGGPETDPSAAADRKILVWVLVGAALARLILLPSFPDIEADEGLWTNSAKNFVLFGDWFMDGRTHVFLSPLFHGLEVAVFAALGPSIAAARLVSALAGVVSTWLVFVLVHRLTGRSRLALLSAVLFGFSEWTVLLSRRALIEPLQLCVGLGAAVVFARRGNARRVVAAGALMALTLLAKLNAAILVVILTSMPLVTRRDGALIDLGPDALRKSVLFGLAAVLLAGAAYGGLYATDPDRFVAAFRFELEGAQFTASDPVARVGRFGFDPVQSGRTVIELFREDPFFFVLATTGVVVAASTGVGGAVFFGVWALLGGAFLVFQVFQPIRYFYLLSPALAFFGAATLDRLVSHTGPGRPSRILLPGVVAVYIAFNLSYLTMNAVANPGTRLPTVTAWVKANTTPDERIMAAGYFCTDLPNRAYARYHLANTPESLLENIRALGIDYVIYDSGEWRPDHEAVLEANFESVQDWGFGRVYRTSGGP